MSSACQIAVAGCEDDSRKVMSDAIDRYGFENGTAAKERILTAVVAQMKKQQISSILNLFQDPRIAPTFKSYGESMLRYEKSLAQVTYQDIRPKDSESKLESAVVWMRQRTAMVIDLAKTKLDSNSDSRYRENDRAAQQLLFSGIALTAKINDLPISEEQKKTLIEQVSALNGSMREQFEGVQNRLGSESKLAFVASGGLASAALVIASAGTLGPAFSSALGGNLTAAGTGAALSGAAGGAGVAGITHVADMSLSAMAAANDKASSFVCELASRVDLGGKDALKDVFNSSWQGALLGGTIGGSLGALAKKAPRLAAAVSALAVVGGGVKMADGTRKDLQQIASANQKISSAKAAKLTGDATEGEVRDAEFAAGQDKAHAYARTVGTAAAVATIATGSLQATRGQKGFSGSSNSGKTLPYNLAEYRIMDTKLSKLGYTSAEIDQLHSRQIVTPEFVAKLRPVNTSEGLKQKNLYTDQKLVMKEAETAAKTAAVAAEAQKDLALRQPVIKTPSGQTPLDFTSDGKAYGVIKSPESLELGTKIVKGGFRSKYLEYPSKNSMGVTVSTPIEIESTMTGGRFVVRIYDREKQTMTGKILTAEELKLLQVKEAPSLGAEIERYKKQFKTYDADEPLF
jgi:hypothetical protein